MSVTDNPTGTEQAEKGQGTSSTSPEQSQAGKQVSSDAPKFTTQSEIDAATKHAVDSAVGRERKAFREERDAMELRSLENQEPSVIDAAKVRQAATRKEAAAEEKIAEAEAKERAANETLDEAKAIKATAEATRLATKHNIDVNVLLGFTTDPTKMDALASILPKVDPNAPVNEPAPEISPDSGVSAGGGTGSFTLNQITDMSDAEYAKNKDTIDKAQREGKIKR